MTYTRGHVSEIHARIEALWPEVGHERVYAMIKASSHYPRIRRAYEAIDNQEPNALGELQSAWNDALIAIRRQIRNAPRTRRSQGRQQQRVNRRTKRNNP